VVFLEQLRGFDCCFLSLGFVANYSRVIDGEMDLSWCSHAVILV
jgi:hypothetical protein